MDWTRQSFTVGAFETNLFHRATQILLIVRRTRWNRRGSCRSMRARASAMYFSSSRRPASLAINLMFPAVNGRTRVPTSETSPSRIACAGNLLITIGRKIVFTNVSSRVSSFHFATPTGAGVPAGEKNHITDSANGLASIFSSSSPCSVAHLL